MLLNKKGNMKKTLLLIVTAAMLLPKAQAQLALTNFNTGLPGTWTMIKVDNNTPSNALNAVIVTALTSNAWMTRYRAAGDSCMLTTSSFTPAGTADRWLVTPSFTVTDAKTIIKWEDVEGVDGPADSLEVWVSPTAGNTVPDFTNKIYSGPCADYATDPSGNLIFVTKGASLGAYNGQTITVAFRNHSYDKGTSRLDNVVSEIRPYNNDGKTTAVSFPKIVANTSNTTVNVTIQNMGCDPITSLDLSYKVDAGTPINQNFTGFTIPPYGTHSFNFTTQITNPAIGQHTITADISMVNGVADQDNTNNQKVISFAVASTTVVRSGVIEEFSSSTCSPCKSFNQVFDPISENGTNLPNVPSSRYNLVRYQMNWPSPGTDYSYNNHGLQRRTYYNCNAIPEHWVNGMPSNTAAGNMQNDIDNSKTAPAFVTITGSYIVDGDSLRASATITPHFSLTGGNYSVQLVAAERHYTNNGPSSTVGQTEYYHVERTMFPDGNGTHVTAWTDGTPQTFSFTKHFVEGNPAQMNDNFWTQAILSDLVIFVQDNDDHSILQSLSVPATLASGVKELNGINDMALFPNPANSEAILAFNINAAANIDITVTDAIGRTVFSYSQNFNAGTQKIVIPTANLSAGVYNVNVRTEKGLATQRLTVVK